MNSLKEVIKSYREKKNISKSELARNIEVSPSYITMLENGEKTNPSLEILAKISTALDVPLDELLLETKKSKPTFNLEAIISQKKKNKPSNFNMMDLLNNDFEEPKRRLLKNSFSVDVDSLTDSQIDEIVDAIRFTIKLKLEEFENNNKK